MRELLQQNDIETTIGTKLDRHVISKHTGLQLEAFVIASRPGLLLSKLQNKGKVESAFQCEKNLIAMAYGCRIFPNMLQEQLVSLQSEEEADTIEYNEELCTSLDVLMIHDY